MTIRGVLPITTDREIFFNTLSGSIAEPLRGFGFRTGISTVATGEDIWPGTATAIPIPADAGEQMSMVSSSASDTLAGTGAQIIHIHYLDASGTPKTEAINMNGTTPVDTIATNIRFIQEMHTIQAGSAGLAVGIIKIYKKTDATRVYTQILADTNVALNTTRMVPAGKILLLYQWGATSGPKDKWADVRLRITSDHGILRPGLFYFHDNFMAIEGQSWKAFTTPIVVPAFAIVKCTAYAGTDGTGIQADWEGVLINTP